MYLATSVEQYGLVLPLLLSALGSKDQKFSQDSQKKNSVARETQGMLFPTWEYLSKTAKKISISASKMLKELGSVTQGKKGS